MAASYVELEHRARVWLWPLIGIRLRFLVKSFLEGCGGGARAVHAQLEDVEAIVIPDHVVELLGLDTFGEVSAKRASAVVFSPQISAPMRPIGNTQAMAVAVGPDHGSGRIEKYRCGMCRRYLDFRILRVR